MLTLLKNIERFNKRYNKKRGSAMLMVLMTMAIIIVVGTSMLFVTLSSFSNSIADTQQERAYNAALVMTETLKSSSYLGKLIESNSFELEQDKPVKLQFNNGDLDEKLDDFTIINGVKVYVTFTNASKEKTSLDSVLVDVRGVKGSQERTVSFTYDKKKRVENVTLKDTFGNALVTNNDLGGEKKRDDLVFKRIEGDISINCWDEEVVDGKTVKKMTTRYFNPIILEGLTGSIFANGDLIIGAADNVIKVQGNIYCDGNLTIRGLDLGVNLPALFKKTYNTDYIKYSTIGNKTFAGFDILGTGEYIEREQEGKVNEAMYLKYKTKNGDHDFLPLQVYDEVSHYTLMDLAPENAETYTFWTRNWKKRGEVEEVTITLRVKVNGELQAVDATYNKGSVNNAQYLGATMYSSSECKPEDMIMQYPKGGNVYCSGDIIFDRVNHGYNWVFSAAAFGGSSKDQYHDLAIYDSTGKGEINVKDKNDRKKVENATVSYNKTKMRGDIFCMGRMIIAPENLDELIPEKPDKTKNYKEAMVFTRMNGSNFNRYLDKDTINNQIYSNGNDFFTRLKAVFGFNGDKWNYNLNKTYNYDYTGGYRLYGNNGNIENREYYKTAENFKNENLKPFIEQLKGTDGKTYTDLKNLFKDIINKEKDNNSGKLYNSDYILKEDNGYLPDGETGDGEHKKLYPVEFSETSNIYIYNWNYASLIENTEKKEGSEGQVKVQRQLNSTSLVEESRVDNTLDNTSVSTVNDTTYKAALTVKYQKLKVNEIYVGSGNIEAVGIDAFGYEGDAEVQAKKIDTLGGEMISNEYQEQSLLDIIMKIYNLDEEQALEKLKTDYWKVDDNFNAVADLSISVKDYQHKEKIGKDINRNGIILSYKVNYTTTVDYECTDVKERDWGDWTRKATWTKKASMPKYGYQEGDNGNVHIKFTYEIEYFMYKGKFYDGNGDEVKDAKIKEVFGWDNATIERFKHNAAKFSDGLFLDLNKAAFESSIKTIVKDYVLQDTSVFPTTFETQRGKIGETKQKESEKKTYDTYRVKPTTSEYDTVETVLKYDSVKDTLKDFVKDVKQLALLSNSDKNSFKAITSKGDVKNMIFAENPITSVGTAAFLSVRAFSDEDHGMYLRSSNARYANADKNSSVSAVFREIIDEGFAKIAILNTTKLTADFMREQIRTGKIIVDEYNQVSDVQDNKSLNPLRKLEQDYLILKELYEGSKKISIDELNNMWANDDPKGRTNFYDIKNLANMNGLVEFLGIGWNEKNINNVWTYIRHRLTKIGSDNKFYAIYNTDKQDDNVRVLRFTNGDNSKISLTCDNTFGLDPLYCSYKKDKDGNLVPVDGDKGGVFVNLLPTIRTQVDYTISSKELGPKDDKNKPRGVYFNFGGEGTGGKNTKFEESVIFGATTDNDITDKLKQINDTKRMNITIDTTYHDVYVYINAPSKYTKVKEGEKGSYVKNGDEYTLVGEGKGDYELQAGIEFRKCSWRVKGKHNAYIMLVGDTSINANAYKLNVNIGGGVNDDSADRSDSMLGTHFYSGFYTTYSGSYTMNEENESSLKLAAKEKETVESGNLCIIGTMGNQVLLGRGGYINGFVYLPNGRYVNNSTGFLGILPNAYSNNNQATIVAKDIAVKGSNIGNLVFQAFDVSSSAGGAGSDIDIDYIESNEKITYTKWTFGGYYYG